MIDQIDSKMLDTIVSSIHNKKGANGLPVAETSSGSFQPITANKQNEMLIVINENDEIKLDYDTIEKNKLFYDVIYNPRQTKFLKKGKELGNQTENGTIMFAYQAQLSFKIWHNIKPNIDEKVLKLLEND